MDRKELSLYKINLSPTSPIDQNLKLSDDKNGFDNYGKIVRDHDIEEVDESQAFRQAESLHLACKALLLLVRHRGSHLKVCVYFFLFILVNFVRHFF